MAFVFDDSYLLLFLAAITLVLLTRWGSRSRRRLPPGPKSLPVFGNMFSMPTEKPWETFHQWCSQYGDVVFLDLPLQPTLIAGSARVALDLLEKRSHIYSDRVMCMMDRLMAWDFNFAFMSYGPEWRQHRRLFHQHFNQGAIDKYLPVQVRQTKQFLQRVLEDPTKLPDMTRLLFAGTILEIVYGMDIRDIDDEYVKTAQMAMEGHSIAHIPGVHWVEYMPILKYIPSWVPGATFKKLVEKYRPYTKRMVSRPYQEMRKAVSEGTAPQSIARTLITKAQERSGESNEFTIEDGLAMRTLAITYAAGADTSTSASQFFLVAMAMYPDIQKKVQAELHSLVGPNRLLEPSDLPDLIYTRAVLLETLRWKPVIPMGLPHRLLQDDEYNGFFIPAGTIVLSSVWTIFRDPEEYPDPDRFMPERFIKDGKINTEVRDPTTIAFGFGRRICPGRHLAEVSLLLAIANILHVFDVIPAPDKNGKSLGTDMEMTTGLVSMPEGIPCILKPRSSVSEALIRDANH